MSSNVKVSCPGCGKPYRWVDAMAGRKVACKRCDQRFWMPAEATGQASLRRPDPPRESAAPKPAAPVPRLAAAPPEPEPEGPSEPMDLLSEAEQDEGLQIQKDPTAESQVSQVPPDHSDRVREVEQVVIEPTGQGDSYGLDLAGDGADSTAEPPTLPPGTGEAASAEADDDDAGLRLDFETAPPATSAREPAAAGGGAESRSGAGKCPSCGSAVKPSAVICINCGYNFKSGTRLQTAAIADEPEPELEPPVAASPAPAPAAAAAAAAPMPSYFALGGRSTIARAVEEGEDDVAYDKKTDLYAPLGLIGFGVAIILLHAFVLGPMAEQIAYNAQAKAWGGSPMQVGIMYSLIELAWAGARLVVQFPLMIVGIFVVAKLFGSSYGSLWTGLLKLLAIVLVIGGVGDCISDGLDLITGGFGWLGYFPRFILIVVTFWALCAWLFEMDALEVAVMFIILHFLPWGILTLGLFVVIAMFS